MGASGIRPKILFVLGNLHMGGAERQALYLAGWLKKNTDFGIHFLAFHGPGPAAESLDASGISWEIVPFDYFFIDRFRRISFSKESFGYFRKWKKQCRDFSEKLKTISPDVILPFTYYPNVICGNTWKTAGAKGCTWNQRDLGIEGMNGFVPERSAIRKTPLFVANSMAGADYLCEKTGIARSRIRVIHNGIQLPDTGLPRVSPRDFGLPEKIKPLVMLGNFHENKDHDTLIRAWKKVKEQRPADDEVLVLAGRFTGGEKKTEQLAGSLGVKDSVFFCDSVKNVYGLLSLAAFSVFSSRREGSPNAVLEAMACGLAVAATDIPACREALGEDYAYLSPPGDSESMSRNILAFLEKPAAVLETGNRNRQRIADHFSMDRMGNAYLEIIRKQLNA